MFLYDWHTHARETGQYFHGFTHPETALGNADRYFRLTGEEQMIILRHMWPLTLITSRIQGRVCNYFVRINIAVRSGDHGPV